MDIHSLKAPFTAAENAILPLICQKTKNTFKNAVSHSHGMSSLTFLEKQIKEENYHQLEICIMLNWLFGAVHYEHTPIQIYWKFHHQKLKVFR